MAVTEVLGGARDGETSQGKGNRDHTVCVGRGDRDLPATVITTCQGRDLLRWWSQIHFPAVERVEKVAKTFGQRLFHHGL
jgi:hypothetical protein